MLNGTFTLEICGPDISAAQGDAILQDDFAWRVPAALPMTIFVHCFVGRRMAYSSRTLLAELGYGHAIRDTSTHLSTTAISAAQQLFK